MKLSKQTNHNVYLFFGDISKHAEDSANCESAHACIGDGWDCFYKFCECPECGEIGIEYDGRSGRISCECDVAEKRYTADSDRLILAYNKAKSARFEFGENGE